MKAKAKTDKPLKPDQKWKCTIWIRGVRRKNEFSSLDWGSEKKPDELKSLREAAMAVIGWVDQKEREAQGWELGPQGWSLPTPQQST